MLPRSITLNGSNSNPNAPSIRRGTAGSPARPGRASRAADLPCAPWGPGRLVRVQCQGTAVASRRVHAVGRAGQRDHAPADTGGPGPARLGGMAAPLAGAGRSGREPAGEAVRSWGRLGYPRRALRLHAAAVAIGDSHGGAVPGTYAGTPGAPRRGQLHRGGRRRVRLRTPRNGGGHQHPPGPCAAVFRRGPAGAGPDRRGDAAGGALLPDDAGASVRWNASVMELGALVCTARAPKCGQCPVRESCAWLAAGEPPPTYTPKGSPGTARTARCAAP